MINQPQCVHVHEHQRAANMFHRRVGQQKKKIYPQMPSDASTTETNFAQVANVVWLTITDRL